MGVQVLAIAVWLGSIAVYGAAFFFPEVHRRHDFFWSGVGGFYGLVLWFSAVQTSPTELLGHVASVVLLGWLGWQTLTLRRKRTPLDLQTPLTSDSWPAFGRQVQQSALNLLKATPLGRWLPETADGRRPGDPAIAISEIRVSSLKDVDYEFVDELEPVSPRSLAAKTDPANIGVVKTEGQVPEAGVTKAASDPAPSARVKRPPRIAERSLRESPVPPTSSAPPPIAPKRKPATVGARLTGFKAWIGDVVKARTTPKPKRAVIEIPPRPSPLAKNKVQAVAKTAAPTDSRPDLAQPPGITIVDTEAIESVEWSDESDSRRERAANRDAAVAPAGQADPIDEPLADVPPSLKNGAEGLGDTEDTNWDDDENWADS